MFFTLTSTPFVAVVRPTTAGTFSNRYRQVGIVSCLPSVSTSVSNSVNNNFSYRTDERRTQPDPVRWWIPLVASTGALLVLVLGTAAMVSTVVNSAISNMG
jgi:ABC-type hemin transport system substrate-binding protein